MTEPAQPTLVSTRRSYLKATALAASGAVGLAGCTGTAAATGTLATQVTDQPGDIGDFESCIVTMQGFWVKPRDDADDSDDDGTGGYALDDQDGVGESDLFSLDQDDGEDISQDDGEDVGQDDGEDVGQDDGEDVDQDGDDVDQSEGREYHEFDEPQEADLVELQGANTQLVDERELDAREYQFLQLDVTGVEGVLEGGDTAEVETPGNAPLQFNEPFEIREDQTTTFVGDFTPVRRGQTERYLLQPVAQGTRVIYEDTE